MNLNIEYHTRLHVKTALKRFKTLKEAADALGISDRTLLRYKKMYADEETHNDLPQGNEVSRN